jgi:hypothetical protein
VSAGGSTLVGVCAAVFVLAAPTFALAQDRFALELAVGGEVVAGPTLHHAVHLAGEVSSGATTEGTPQLEDRFVAPGLTGSLRVTAGSLEFGYELHRNAWSNARTRCIGDRLATRLPDGEVDDATVIYDCSADAERDLATDELPAQTVHVIGGGLRFYGRPRRASAPGELRTALDASRMRFADRLRWYGVGGMGLALTTFDERTGTGRIRPGAALAAGGGLEVELDSRIRLVLDGRYRFAMLSRATSESRSANRAAALDRGPIGAILETQHSFVITMGVRLSLR